MAIEIKMPALSPTMEEGTLAKWLVADGDEVRSGDVIAEIETDKATMEVEAIEDGKIGQILVPAGTQHVKVNAVIAMLLEDGESASDMKLFMSSSGAPLNFSISALRTRIVSGASAIDDPGPLPVLRDAWLIFLPLADFGILFAKFTPKCP